MTQDVIYEFSSYADAKAAIHHIEREYILPPTAGGLSYVIDDDLHIVAACTYDDEEAEEIRKILEGHHGSPSTMDLDTVFAIPATARILGNAGAVLALLR